MSKKATQTRYRQTWSNGVVYEFILCDAHKDFVMRDADEDPLHVTVSVLGKTSLQCRECHYENWGESPHDDEVVR